MLFMLDMDGTLIEGFLDKKPRDGHDWCDGDVYADVVLLPNVKDRLRFIVERDNSARFAICTNQAGVAFGYQTEEDARRKVSLVLSELEFFWSRPFSVHICFNHPNASVDLYKYDDLRRKPNAGMLLEAIKWHDNEDDPQPLKCLMVGDMDADKGAAAAAGVPYLDHASFFLAITCDQCGGTMMRAGSTYVCEGCGHNLGAM